MATRRGRIQPDEETIKTTVQEFERRLRSNFAGMAEAILGAEGQGSYSMTLAGKRSGATGKKIKWKLTTRLRAPEEPFEFDGHVDDSGQLGFGPLLAEPEGEGGEE